MHYAQRREGKYYLRPIAIDHQHERYEISEKTFYERWRRWAALDGPEGVAKVEAEIAETKQHNDDFDVF